MALAGGMAGDIAACWLGEAGQNEPGRVSLPRSSHGAYQAAVRRSDISWGNGGMERMQSSNYMYAKYWDHVLVPVLDVLGLRQPTAVRAYHKHMA